MSSDIIDQLCTRPVIKPEVRRRLDEIAAETHARIAVVNIGLPFRTKSSEGGSSGLHSSVWETEPSCELYITGHSIQSVSSARVKLLVMLDELVSSDLVSAKFYNKKAVERIMRRNVRL